MREAEIGREGEGGGPATRYRLGVDVGGTFTDFTLFDEATGDARVYKTSTTPADQSEAIVLGTLTLLESMQALASDIVYLAHGTTVATNAVLEGKVARVGLITTRGFRDLLEIRRQKRPTLYDLFYAVPEPLITRDLRLEVDERIDADGRVIRPLDMDGVRHAVSILREQGVEAIAILFLNSYVNRDHEQAAAGVARAMVDVPVWASSDVLPEFREFERLSTTVMNAALGPVMRHYLGRLASGIEAAGISASPHVMQSNGGVMSLGVAADRPVNTLMSGPSAGVMGATYIAGLSGVRDLITFDMGGTSTDVCLVRDGMSNVSMQRELAGYPVRAPSVDVTSIGSGGGSIAWVDTGGRLKVGPQSQGARPGPAAYGLGGVLPTVSDAHVTLGRLGADRPLAGRMPLHAERAREAIEAHVARPLGVGVIEAAHAIIRIANANMVLAARSVSVERGYDPRDFALVAFGGAGPLHAVDVAAELGVNHVLVPEAPGIVCALGLLTTDLRADFVRTVRLDCHPSVLPQANRVWAELEDAAEQWLDVERASSGQRLISRSVDMRYVGQNYEIRVAGPPGSWGDRDLGELEGSFRSEHDRAYGYSTAERMQIVSLRVAAIGVIPKVAIRASARSRRRAQSAAQTSVYWAGSAQPVSTLLYDRSALLPGQVIDGPAIIGQMDSTTLVPANYRATVDAYRSLRITLAD